MSDVIPIGWKLTTVGQACSIRNDYRLPISKAERSGIGGDYPYYGPTGILDWIAEYRLNGTFALIGEDGDHFLDFTVKPQTLLVSGRFNVNNHAHVIESTNACDAEWFYNYFRHRNIREYLTRQGAGRYKLNKATLERLTILLPPISEQRSVNRFFREWDATIEKTQRLIEMKLKIKRMLMAQLLTGEKRLKGYKINWQSYHLGELFRERSETGYEKLPLLSITGEAGIILRDGGNRKDSSSEDKSSYLRICPGDIGYNTMRMWQGVSALSSLEGIVSPAYTVCTPKNGVDGQFMAYLFKLPRVINLFYRHSQGLTSDTWNLKFHNFAKIKVTIPDIEEQKAIVKVLKVCDEEIRLLKIHLEAIKKQKRGLMQKLLTGEWRVKAFMETCP